MIPGLTTTMPAMLTAPDASYGDAPYDSWCGADVDHGAHWYGNALELFRCLGVAK